MIYSTGDVHPRERLSYWREVATRGYVEHELRPKDRSTFQGKVKLTSLPGVGLAAFDAEAHSIRPNGQEESGDLLLSALYEGEVGIIQDGRDSLLRGPSLYLVDPTRPFELTLRERCTHVIAKIPRAMLEARIGHTGDLTGRSIDASQGVGPLAMGMIKLLPDQAEALDDIAGLKIAEQMLDLVGLTLNAARGTAANLSSSRTLALLRLKSTVERLMTAPGVKPDRIAAEAGISIRYANALLAEENWSIERYLNERRLERCRAAFDDPAQAHRNVGEICFKWGFSDLSHFGRRFKARYGLTPTEYRARHIEQIVLLAEAEAPLALPEPG